MLKVARTDQVPEITDLVLRFISESPYSELTTDRTKVEDVIFATINNPDGLVLISIEDRITGVLVAVANEALFSRERWASELAWYIVPEKRSLSLTRAFLRTYEYWASKVECKGISLACLADHVLTKLYTRYGYEEKELAFFKEI